ncbi:L-Aspartase-like protein [Aspergillus aurantiobrunneus]
MNGADISMASYMAELGYLSNPVSSHVQSAEMCNQAINSMALVSARYCMQAVEVLSLMCACDLYIACQALDLRALHLAFLENAKTQLHSVTSSIFSTYLPQPALTGLNESLDQHLLHAWPTTNRLSAPDRVHTVIENALSVVLNNLKTYRWLQGPGLGDIDAWMYETVRQDLGAPFHQGFIEHPTLENETLNTALRRPSGRGYPFIYEAIRDEKLMSPLMQSLSPIANGLDAKIKWRETPSPVDSGTGLD